MLITIFFYLTFFLFSLGQLGRMSFMGQQVNIYLYETALIFSLFFLFLKYRFIPIIFYFRQFRSIFIFFTVLLISFLFGIFQFSLENNLIGFLYFLRLFTYFLYFFYLLYHLRTNGSFIKIIKNGIMIFIVSTIITSLTQYFLYPDLRNLIYQGWDPHLYRLFGVFFDSFVAASIYGLIFFAVLFKFKGFSKNILLSVFFIFTILTFSRGAYLAFVISLLVYFLHKKDYKKIIFSFLIFSIILFVIPKPFGEGVNLKRTFSIESRFEDDQKALRIFIKNPVLGVGYNRLRYVKKAQIDSHAGASFSSSFMTILASSGIVGLIAFLLVLINLAKINIYTKIIVIFLSIFSLFDNVILHPFILFLLLIGIIFTKNQIFQKTEDRRLNV